MPPPRPCVDGGVALHPLAGRCAPFGSLECEMDLAHHNSVPLATDEDVTQTAEILRIPAAGAATSKHITASRDPTLVAQRYLPPPSLPLTHICVPIANPSCHPCAVCAAIAPAYGTASGAASPLDRAARACDGGRKPHVDVVVPPPQHASCSPPHVVQLLETAVSWASVGLCGGILALAWHNSNTLYINNVYNIATHTYDICLTPQYISDIS